MKRLLSAPLRLIRALRGRVALKALHSAANVPGYSDSSRAEAFDILLRKHHPRPQDVLMLGVYFGRDVVLMSHIMRRGSIVGVDKFSDDYCDDWPQDIRGKSWEDAGFGDAPDLTKATQLVERWKHASVSVKLVRARDEDFLSGCTEKFDLVYLDTSHDERTVRRQIRQALPLLREGGSIAGDDFSDEGTWGVATAVRDSLQDFALLGGTVWCSHGPKPKG